MKFSILIAHYNNWNYFQECYQSIQNQTYQDYEIIIVDDSSTDNSFQNLKELASKDSKIKLFQNSVNKKVGFTKRRCVEVASGDVCLFVDPDDKIVSDALEIIYSTYKTNHAIIATYSKIQLIDNKSKELGDFKFSKKIKNNNSYFFNINFEIAHLFSFKKSYYSKTVGINETLTSAVDQDLYMKLYEIGEFYFIDNFQYLYRLHDKGVSQDKSKKNILSSNWNTVLLETCKRRGITKLYGKEINQIENLSNFIFKKENTIIKKLLRKFI